MLEEGLGKEKVTEKRVNFWRFLGSLGSHDLSLMREVLGFPEKVTGVSAHHPFYTAIFEFRNRGAGMDTNVGPQYSCTYESGIDAVARFDSHLTVYGENKTVSIHYDTPYIKGLPIKVKVDEIIDGEAVSKEILSSFEDAYTAELQEFWECVVKGRAVKTSVKDALEDLELWEMMLKKHDENES